MHSQHECTIVPRSQYWWCRVLQNKGKQIPISVILGIHLSPPALSCMYHIVVGDWATISLMLQSRHMKLLQKICSVFILVCSSEAIAIRPPHILYSVADDRERQTDPECSNSRCACLPTVNDETPDLTPIMDLVAS